MIAKTGLQVLVLTFVLFVSSQVSKAQTRIKLAVGKKTSITKGAVRANSFHSYLVSGKAGQTLSITVRSKSTNLFVQQEEDDLGEAGIGLSFQLESDGDHRFVVLNEGRKAASYTLIVSLR